MAEPKISPDFVMVKADPDLNNANDVALDPKGLPLVLSVQEEPLSNTIELLSVSVIL